MQIKPILILTSQLLSLRWTWFILLLLPFIILFTFVSILGVDIPFSDELAYAPLLTKVLYSSNELEIKDFFLQINEHILLFPTIITVIIVYLFGWHASYTLLVNPTLAIINFLFLYKLIHATLKHYCSPVIIRMFGLFVAVIIASLTQWEIWSQSITTNIYLANTALLAAIYILYRRKHNIKILVLAAFFCFVSSFSANQGLISWLAVLPLIALNPANKKPRLAWHKIIAWLMLFVSTTLIYYALFTKPSWPPSVWYGLYHPLELLLFIVTLIGTPLFPLYHFLTPIFGIALLTTSFILIVNFSRDKKMSALILPWACIWLYSFLATSAIAVGRVGFGVSKATQSRYLPISILMVISAIYLLLLFLSSKKNGRLTRLLSFFIISLIIAQVGFSADLPTSWLNRNVTLEQGKACLETYSVSTDLCLSKLGNSEMSGGIVKKYASTLEKLGAFNQLVIPDNVKYTAEPQTAMGLMEIECLDEACFKEHTNTSRFKIIQAKGWAQLYNCQPAEHIVITYGPDHRLVAHTTTVNKNKYPNSNRACLPNSFWEIDIDLELIETNFNIDLLEAWIYDNQSNNMYLLPSSLVPTNEFRRSKHLP